MGLSDPECVDLLRWACPRLGLRWDGFRNVRGQVCKRIARRMAALGLDAKQYRARLESTEDEWIHLDAACRVTISRFFRDRAVWEALRDRLLPERARRAVADHRTLRIWSAGCASGEEPYSAALVLRLAVQPADPQLRWEIVATDSDPTVLERAKRACYPPGTLAELPPEWAASAFHEVGTERCLNDALRDGITWLEQDLRRELPDGSFDVIFCRNLAFTYFAPEAQPPTLTRLLARLRPGGLLILGAHERLPTGAEAALQRIDHLPIFTPAAG